MVKVFCDKCGKELNRAYMYTGSIFSPEITNWDSPFIEDPTSFDLCTDCAELDLSNLKDSDDFLDYYYTRELFPVIRSDKSITYIPKHAITAIHIID